MAVNAVALLGKLGHVPWALSIRNWFTSPSAVDVAVLGYDVCHLPDPRRPSQLQHVAAGIRLSSEQPLVLSNVSFRTERVRSETVPPESLRKLLPKDFARGKLIIVHRDGERLGSETKSIPMLLISCSRLVPLHHIFILFGIRTMNYTRYIIHIVANSLGGEQVNIS